MKLKSLLLATVAGVGLALSSPGAAKADPITAAIVGFIGLTGTAAAVATFVINSALYAGASWALGKASRALGKQKQSVQERQASVLQLTIGEVPREMAFGHTCSGGSLVDAFNHGGQYGTDKVTRIIALADHAIDALVGYYVDDQYVAWSGSGTQAGFGGTLAMEFRDATGTAVSLPTVAADGGWGASDKLIGVTHVWVTYAFDDKVWTQGHPQFRFVFRGLRVYDPRKDAALGYTGPSPHDWADRSTHAFTQNAALIRYAYQRGIYTEGHQGEAEHLLIGRGLSAEEAPPERVIAAANVCDEVTGPSELRYIAAGVIRASDDFVQVETWFADAMAGVIVQREGGLEIEPGQAKAAVVTITDQDLVIGEPVTYSEFLPDTDGGRINTVVPRYVEPGQNWADHSGPVRRDFDDITEDGGPREETLALPIVTSGPQADRCAEIKRRLGRLERRASIVLPPRFSYLEEGDWIAWTSARRHGGATRRYRIESWSRDRAWRVRLSLREIASSVYGVPDPVEDTSAPPPPPTPVDALELDGVSVSAITLAGEISVVPALRFAWDTPVDAGMIAVRAEVRTGADADVATTRTEDLTRGVLVVTNGVRPGGTLQGRLVPIGDPTRPVLPSAWVTVSTAEVTAEVDPDSPALDLIRDDLLTLDQAVAILELRRTGVRNLIFKALWEADALDAVTWGVSHWGLRLVGTGGVVVVDALPLPLKPNVAYSLRFRARVTAGAGPQTLSIDLFPTGLPGTTRTVTTTDTSFVFEGIASSSSNMGVAQLRFFGTVPTGTTVEITDILLVEGDTAPLGWIPAPEEGAVIDGRLVQLETWRGTATVQISSLTLALSTEQATRAAQISSLRAVWRGRALNLNPAFAEWPDAGTPTAWSTSGSVDRVSGLVSEYAAQLNGAASIAQQNTTALRALGGGWFVLEADIRLLAGTLASGTLGLQVYSDGYASLLGGAAYTLSGQKTAAGAVAGSGAAGESYRWRILIDGRSSATRLLRPYVQSATGTTLAVDFLSVRFATDSEIETGTTLPALSAEVEEQSEVLLDHATFFATARWRVRTAASGGNPAVLELISSTGDPSAISMAADQIWFGANTVFVDASDTLQTLIGTGATRRVIALGAPFGASSNLIQWRGPSSIALSAMTIANAAYWETETESGGTGLGGGSLRKLTTVTGTAGASGVYEVLGSVTLTGVPSGGAVIEALYEITSVSASNWTGIIALVENNGSTSNTIFGSLFELIGGVTHVNGIPGPVRMYGTGTYSGTVIYLIMGASSSSLALSAGANVDISATKASA